MKKCILSALMAVTFSIANAYTLFPHFGDVVGDYEDGTPQELIDLNLPTDHYRITPFFFSDLKSADEFLMDTLPFSNYTIDKDQRKLDDGTEIIIYRSSLEADGLNKDKWSELYLVQMPDGKFIVGIAEDSVTL